MVCPTGAIAHRRGAGSYQIWGRTFADRLATVTEQRCVGCGACEEACPFDVPRVALRRGGQRVAEIPADHCRGCGACVGACPSGAIQQQGLGWEVLVRHIAGEGGDA
jgi:ferredoxin